MNNLHQIKKIINVIFLLLLVSGCASSSHNYLKSKILQENCELTYYKYESEDMNMMLRGIQDSLEKAYYCDTIDFLTLVITEKNNTVYFSFNEGGNSYGYTNTRNNYSLLEVNSVLILVRNNNLKILNTIGKLTNNGHCLLRTKLKPDFNECLYVKKRKTFSNVIFSIEFKKNENSYQIRHFIHYIE